MDEHQDDETEPATIAKDASLVTTAVNRTRAGQVVERRIQEQINELRAQVHDVRSQLSALSERLDVRIEPAVGRLETHKLAAEEAVERVEELLQRLQSQLPTQARVSASGTSAAPAPVAPDAESRGAIEPSIETDGKSPSTASPARDGTPSTGAEHVRAFTKALNSGDMQIVRQFIEAHYAAAAQDDVSIDQRLEVYAKLHNHSQGIDLKGVRQSADNELLMLAQGRATGDWHSYRFELEADEPHRVLRVQIDPLEASEAEALMGG